MPRGRARAALGTAVRLAARPRLWPVAARQAALLARPGGGDYLRFRLVTAYGDTDRPPEPDDVVTWLAWCRSYPRGRR